MEFVMNRDRIVRTVSGHVLGFKKGEPLHVPYAAREDAMQAGAVPADPDAAEAEAKEADERKAAENAPPPTGEERVEKIKAGINALRERNARGDFNGSGLPDVKALSTLVGFAVDAKERTAMFEQVMAEEVEA